jgi:peptidoglycan/xylan/chitin deacetylase (PgdA/CDA1 family)
MPCGSNTTGLTIDDGPDPVSTPLILDVLRDNGVTATFFVVGKRGEKNKELLERITHEGHELANHTYNDKVTISLNGIELKKSIKNTHDILSEFQTILWFRPGAAFYNSNIVEEIKSYEYKLVIGDVFPFDTIISSSQFHSWYIKTSVQPGSIIIMHDARGKGIATANSLAMVLPQLNSMGYRVTSLGDLKSKCEIDA